MCKKGKASVKLAWTLIIYSAVPYFVQDKIVRQP